MYHLHRKSVLVICKEYTIFKLHNKIIFKKEIYIIYSVFRFVLIITENDNSLSNN